MTKRPNRIEAHKGPAHPGPDALLDAVLHYTTTIGVLQSERDGFRQRCDTLQTALDHSTAELAATKDELARLEHVIRQLKRARFGSSSERVDPEQLQLALEGCEQDIAAATAAVTEAAAKIEAATTGAKPKRPPARNRGHLPSHLEEVEREIDVEDKACPCCGGEMHKVREDVAKQLDIVPRRLRILVTRRPIYGCRSCAEAMV